MHSKKHELFLVRELCNGSGQRLPSRRRQIRTTPMRHFRRHANAFAQRGMRMNRLADIHCISTHFNGQRNLANHVASMGANHAAAENLVVAVGFIAVVRQQLGHAFIPAVGNRSA